MASLSTIYRVVVRLSLFLSLFLCPSAILLASTEDPAAQGVSNSVQENHPGQFFTITEPITSETLEQVRQATRQVIERYATLGQRPTLVFEIRPGETNPGTSDFFASYSLASFLASKLEGAHRTVAYVPEPLKGPVALVAFACDEIVMGTEASLGPLTPETEQVDVAHKENVRILAERKGRDPNLLAGLLDRNLDLRAIETADKQFHFVPLEEVAAFQVNHAVIRNQSAWEGSSRGVLNARFGRELGVVQLLADTASEVANAYHFAGQSVLDDPTLGQKLNPVWILIRGPLDNYAQRKIALRIEQAIRDKVNLIFFQFDTGEGSLDAADSLADLIAGLKGCKTVAYIEDQALGVTALSALACSDLVLHEGAVIGEISGRVVRRRRRSNNLDEREIQAVKRRAMQLSEEKGHPAAVVAAMIDPSTTLYEATDSKSGANAFVLQEQIDAEPNRFLNLSLRKSPGEILSVTAAQAPGYGLGRLVQKLEECKGLYGLRGKAIREFSPGAMDSFVAILTEPIVSWLLLFIGLFMLVLELKLPGIGLPAITSCMAFLLFFWSRYLSGTADQLEIIIFLVGMICLALELFVFPGFGVFGMSGILLVLTSIVLASHTFAWPSKDYEYREMGFTLIQVMAAMVAVGVGAVVLARYFPSLPIFNRLVLKPEPWLGNHGDLDVIDSQTKPSMEGYDSLLYLIGETGRTITVLRPSGKAKFGNLVIDVKTEGDFIEPDCLIEVVEVQGNRVVVTRLDI